MVFEGQQRAPAGQWHSGARPELALTGPITGDQIPFFDARRDGQDDEYRSELTARVDALFRETGARQVVISAENLSEGDTRPAPWFSDLAAKYETEVIVYLRRQDEVLLSAWQQWDAKIQPDFWTWIVSRAGILADWQTVLERWEAVVGRECIRARLYERERLPDGDVVRDFEQVVKFDQLGLSWTPNAMINARFSEVVVDLVTAGGFFTDIYDFDFYNFVTDMTGTPTMRGAATLNSRWSSASRSCLGTERVTPGSGRLTSRTAILRRPCLRCPGPASTWCEVGMSYDASKYSWSRASFLSLPGDATANGWEA